MMVEHSTHNPKIRGSGPAPATGREQLAKLGEMVDYQKVNFQNVNYQKVNRCCDLPKSWPIHEIIKKSIKVGFLVVVFLALDFLVVDPSIAAGTGRDI